MPQDPMAATIQNLFRLQRLSNGLGNEGRRRIREMMDEIIAEIVRLDLPGMEGRFVDRSIARLMERTRAITAAGCAELSRDYREELAAIGRLQADWAAERLLGEIALGGTTIEVTARGMGE